MGWRFILSLIFSVIVALFAIANSGVQRINFIFAQYDVSMAIVILVSAICGAVIVLLLSIIKSIKLKFKISSLEKTVGELKKDKEKAAAKITELEQKIEGMTQIPEAEASLEEASSPAETIQKPESMTD